MKVGVRMGGSPWDNGSYRGRKTLQDLLKLIVAILGILVLLAVAFLIFGQQYIVYTSDGIRLELPFLSPEEQEEPLDELPEIKLEVQQPEPEPEPEIVHALLTISISAMLEGQAEALAQAAGANGVIVDMKDDAGALYWYLDDPAAAAQGLNSQPPIANALVRALTDSDLHTVARISCFKDHGLARDAAYAILTNSGYLWTDPEKLRWTSPASEVTRAYLIQRMTELAELGFDEILLDNCGYPTRGNLGYIRVGAAYPRDQLHTVMEGFFQQAEQALEQYDVLLSLRCSSAVFTGADTRSGLTAALLERYIDRLWLTEEGGAQALETLTAQAGITGGSKRLVLVLSALDGQQTSRAQAEMTIPNF